MKLRNRILMFAIPLTLVPFVLVALAAYYFVIRAYRVQADEQQNAILREAIASIRKERDAARRDIEMLANLPSTIAYLSAVGSASPGKLDARTSDLKATLQLFGRRNAYCLGLYVVDSQGQPRVGFSKLPGAEGLSLAKSKDYLRRALITGTFQSPVEEVRPDRFASVLAHRVQHDAALGAVVLYLNTDVFQRSLRPLLASHGLNTFLFDDRGMLFARSVAGADEENCIGQLDLSREADALLELPSLEISRKNISRGGRSFVFSVLPAEALVRSFIEPQSGENWFLGVIKPQDATLGSGFRFTATFFATLLAAVAAVFWATTRYARRVTVPLEQVTAATSRIALGEFDINLAAETRDEVEDLATAVKQMADDLKKYRAELVRSEKLATIGEMASEISHEIQNRVSGVSLWIQYLDAELEKDDPRREYLEEMKEGLGGFTRLLEELKQFYKTPILHLTEVNLNELIKTTLPVVDQRLKDRMIEVELEPGANLPPVVCDAEKIRSVILNLMVNAIDAVEENGVIEIRTSPLDAKAVELVVRDNGCGIAKQDLPRIFYPFYSTKGSGGGLGLAITSNIVAAHGGTIEVASNEGEGATFTIKLPVTASDSESRSPDA